MEANQDRRRGHFHRARRGQDRRGGPDRRTPAPAQSPPRDQVNVEQIMREIRTRVAARNGVELSNEQIQDLAARRLESILDPRSIKPSLLEGLKRNAGAAAPSPGPKLSSEPAYTFEDTTIYDSHRAVLRWIRKLLNPLLKLFFNPNPLIRALHLQAGINTEAAARDAERDRRQAEWNALHYEILQRLVTEVARLSLETQALAARLESVDGRVDFADRRVRMMEAAQTHARPSARDAAPAAPSDTGSSSTGDVAGEGAADAARRRRRRRRGRRSGAPPMDGSGAFRQPSDTDTAAAEAIEPDEMADSGGPAAHPPVEAELSPSLEAAAAGPPPPEASAAEPSRPSVQESPAMNDVPQTEQRTPGSPIGEDPL